jgi:hypothetical protein
MSNAVCTCLVKTRARVNEYMFLRRRIFMVQVLFSSTFRETRLLSLKVSKLGNCRGVDMHQFGVDMHQFFFLSYL